jgi:transcriptional regulator with XRE-family HTH domain
VTDVTTAGELTTSERIAANVRAEMGRQNLKTAALARRAGIETRTTYRLVNGERRWEAEQIESVAAVLGVDWLQLVASSEVAA